MENNKLAIDFIEWCNTPVYQNSNELGAVLRVSALYPEYNSYVVRGKNGKSILPEGVFLTSSELFDYFIKNQLSLDAQTTCE